MSQESTVANADLWTRYFQNEWSRWGASPHASVSAMAEGTAARVAGFLTLVAAGPIAWMYSSNANAASPIEGEVAPASFTVTGDELDSVEETAA